MKTIILVRHGKSSWKQDVDDMFRPLKPVGSSNTIKVSDHFKSKTKITLKNVFTSPAKRALDTCVIFVNNFVDNFVDKSSVNIEVVKDLYDFNGEKLVLFIKNLSDNMDTVFLFGHNNAFTNFVNSYGDKFVDNVPTSGLVVLEFNIDRWCDLAPGHLKLKLFPKALK
ncbi:histidine phosphatase family protein [Formosa sediminum]|uniref:Histidine phosphatase family protein n=1 Tax=Formosa sediminum TaxID=2594004 RepID=A0A516GW15_9FLAO|nr:histidine phosphatase family protein [Formosa sediminum]QDO95570.1 histidine phosphatase family protein [Formosa sediminum]